MFHNTLPSGVALRYFPCTPLSAISAPSKMCSKTPDMPQAGDIRIWLFVAQGEKRPFKCRTLYLSGMSDYVMPVLVGLYAAFAIAVMAVTPIMAS